MPFSTKHCPVVWSTVDARAHFQLPRHPGHPLPDRLHRFAGRIFATEPSIEFGRQILEDLANSWTQLPHCGKLEDVAGHPLADQAENWMPVFTAAQVQSAFDSVQRVSFNQRVQLLNDLLLTPVSSGFCIGGCNWLIESDFHRMAYMSASSQWTCHPLPMSWQALVGCDLLLFNGACLLPGQTPDRSVEDICSALVTVLSQGGSALFPCRPCGVLFDLLESISNHLDAKGMRRYPMYLVSARAKNSLSFADICGEWLSAERQKRLYTADVPFGHAEMLQQNQLQQFSSLGSDFGRQCSQPCIVFATDPCLRLGEAVHLAAAWGRDRANALFLTDPQFADVQTLAPFQPLAMPVHRFTMDMRMQPSQAADVLSLLRCGRLVMPEAYRRLDCHGGCPVSYSQYLSVMQFPLDSSDQLLELSPALARTVRPVRVGDRQLALLEGEVTMGRSGRRRLEPLSEAAKSSGSTGGAVGFGSGSELKPLLPRCAEELVRQLRARNFPGAKHELAEDGSWSIFLEVGHQEALITGSAGATHVYCDDEKIRLVVRESLLACLVLQAWNFRNRSMAEPAAPEDPQQQLQTQSEQQQPVQLSLPKPSGRYLRVRIADQERSPDDRVAYVVETRVLDQEATPQELRDLLGSHALQ
uniref:Beta-Casp domain-containing protein n=1 Tax=Macrostomum lignano TaxID=282301 RepID=A0A1I8FFU5_9PLAT